MFINKARHRIAINLSTSTRFAEFQLRQMQSQKVWDSSTINAYIYSPNRVLGLEMVLCVCLCVKYHFARSGNVGFRTGAGEKWEKAMQSVSDCSHGKGSRGGEQNGAARV